MRVNFETIILIFDIFIDDNCPYNFSKPKKNLKISVITNYKFNESSKGKNVYRVKTSVSDLTSVNDLKEEGCKEFQQNVKSEREA